MERAARSRIRSVTAVGVAGLALTKAADVVTTVVGLRGSAAVTEVNPVAGAAIAAFGAVPGLLALGAVTVAAIVCVVEGAFALTGTSATGDRTREDSGPGAPTGRLVCYAVGCACNLAFALHNAVLIAHVGAF